MSDHEDTAALEAEIDRRRAENDALAQSHDTTVLERPAEGHRRWRWTAAVAILVVAALLTPPALVGFWGRRTIVDTQRYLATVGPLAQSPQIQEAVATAATDELLSLVDIEGFISTNLPPAAGVLAPAISGAVEDFVQSSVEKFMASDAFDQLWINVNTKVQEDLVKALRGEETGSVQVRDGVVYLDLGVVIQGVQQALVDRGLTIFDKITVPDQTGREIVLLDSPQLKAAQTVWTFTEPIARWLLPIVFLLYLAAVLVAPNRRRMLLVAGLVVVGGMALLAIALNIARASYVGAVSSSSFSDALKVFYDTMLRYLWGSLGALATLGLFLAFFAWLGGPSAPAGWLRGVESRATTALGETAGRWAPLASLGRLVRRGRTALRAVVIGVVIVVFLLNGVATWQNVLWAVGIVVALWLLVDVLAAATSGSEPTPPAEVEQPVPVDA